MFLYLVPFILGILEHDSLDLQGAELLKRIAKSVAWRNGRSWKVSWTILRAVCFTFLSSSGKLAVERACQASLPKVSEC